MKEKEKICLDLDGVVFNSLETYVNKYNILYNKNKTVNDIKEWYFFKSFNLTAKEGMNIFHSFTQLDTKMFSNELIPFTIYKLKKYYDIDIFTAKHNHQYDKIKQALHNNGIFEKTHYDKLIVSYNDKIPYHKALYPYDIYIDDGVPLGNYLKNKSDKILYCPYRTYNKDLKGNNIFRYTYFFELLKLLIESDNKNEK